MIRRSQWVRKGTAIALASVMLTLSVAIPVYERADVNHGTVAENQHAPGHCPTGHNHTICTQVGANAPATSARATYVIAPVEIRAPTVVGVAIAAAGAFPEGHPSRAPPPVLTV